MEAESIPAVVDEELESFEGVAEASVVLLCNDGWDEGKHVQHELRDLLRVADEGSHQQQALLLEVQTAAPVDVRRQRPHHFLQHPHHLSHQQSILAHHPDHIPALIKEDSVTPASQLLRDAFTQQP